METLSRWMAGWPLPLLHWLGGLVGWSTYLLSSGYRHRFDGQVAQAGVTPSAARGAIAEAGRMITEAPRLWLAGAGTVPLAVTGRDVVDAALAKGRGVVFMTPHLGCFEITAQAYALQFGARHPMTVLYRPARKAWVRTLSAARARPGLSAVPADLGGVRSMLRALRRGEAVGLLPDQVPPDGMGVWAPFFGRDAYTMTLGARLVQQSGAAVLLVWGERLPRGAGYVVHFEPFGDLLPTDANAQTEAATVVNRAMERMILRCPAQYLWGYHRYKAPRRTVEATVHRCCSTVADELAVAQAGDVVGEIPSGPGRRATSAPARAPISPSTRGPTSGRSA